MAAEYAHLPSSPPSNGVPRPSMSPRRWAVRIALALLSAGVLHYAVLGFRAQHMPPRPHAAVVTEDTDAMFAELVTRPNDDPSPSSYPAEPISPVDAEDAEGNAEEGGHERLSAETLRILAELPRGPYVKDVYPIRTMRAFLELTEAEIKRAGVDTCRDRLGVPLIREWAKTGKSSCKVSDRGTELRSSITPAEAEVTGTPARQRRDIAGRYAAVNSEERESKPETHDLEPGSGSITCFNPKDGRGSSWWVMGSYPCLSTGLETSGNASRFVTPLDCTLPKSRHKSALANILDHGEVECKEWVNTTTVLVHRRDEWNPFHVSEDLLTALLNLLVVAEAEPSLATERVQLAFSDEFAIANNHYAALWDSVGAHSPRILQLDPYGPDTCFRRLLHGTAHTSPTILTVIPVNRFSGCASAITWTASHYMRYLMGYLPPGLPSHTEVGRRSEGEMEGERKVIRVLFLSRMKLDKWFLRTRQYSHWRLTRHIDNEPQLLDHLASEFAELCSGTRCEFERIDDEPDRWLAPGPSSSSNEGPVVRFAVLDPLLIPLQTQSAYMAHTDVVIGARGGALALTLFTPPGKGAMIELQSDEIYERNYHFKNLCYQLGRRYQELLVKASVDPKPVWDAVRAQVELLL